MAQVVAAFGSSHTTMLVSSVEHWQEMFDRVDRRAPINDFDGAPRTFDELLKSCRRTLRQRSPRMRMAERHRATMAAMDRLERDIAASGIDVLVIIGDDQREMFKDALAPGDRDLLRRHHPQCGRAAGARRGLVPARPAQADGGEGGSALSMPSGLATAIIKGLIARNFDITAMKSLDGDQFEGHAYSFIHRRFMPKGPIPIVPVHPQHLLSAQSAEPAALFGPWRRHSRAGRGVP